VTAMHDWVRGLGGEQAGSGSALGGGVIEDAGWQIEVTEQQWVTDEGGQAVLLPKRFEAHRPPHRIRVVFGQWEWGKNRPNG